MNQSANSLIDVYIKNDDRKKLWELAFEFGNEIDLNKIASYYIVVRDAFHICELISAVSEYLDLETIFDNINLTNDKNFMLLIANNPVIKSIIDYTYLYRLEKACA